MDLVAKTEDEIYVLNTIKTCSYLSFVFFIISKKVELLKISCHAKFVGKKRINFLVSPYSNLLFSRKEIIKFSEVALVLVHCNCLISCKEISQGYQS